MKRVLLILLLMMICAVPAFAEDEDWSLWENIDMNGTVAEEASPITTPEPVIEKTARDDFIDRIVALGEELYIQADGKSQRAHYKGDIYLCKNFTTHIFNELRDDFCMAEYPDVRLRIPNNEQDSSPYKYGLEWEDVPAEDGNPFEEVARFRYDKNLTREENLALACDFMRQAQRGDFFQMSADYEYGMGAHSAIMLSYDAENDEIHWMDSNMRGGKRNGIRYGICQFDEVRSVEWWANAFCVKGRGATLYRLRDDIVYREGREP